MRQLSVVWQPWLEAGLEKLRLDIGEEEVLAIGDLVRLDEGRPWQGRYLIVCDGGWRVRSVDIDLGDTGSLGLRADGEGNWRDVGDRPLPALAGCIDIDISATPFTNTLPIRRLKLPVGGSAELAMCFIELPALRAQRTLQRYTRLTRQRWRIESPADNFTAKLTVDTDGLVRNYPDLFRRVPV